MMLACLMVIAYISCCVCVATRPCKYFQLNAAYFDREKGIFSKLDTDRLIPPEWRLAQFIDDGTYEPQHYPVFVKPEWSQNARGVRRADNAAQLRRIREEIRGAQGRARGAYQIQYLIQEGAPETREYEIFSIQHHRDPARHAVLTVTEARNDSEACPVNSIYNTDTRYVEITGSFSDSQLEQLWALVRRTGRFRISRLSVRANSTGELLRGKFHIIEINLFLPMPINMLDRRHSRRDNLRFIMAYMLRLALATKHRDRSTQTKPVFTKSMLYNRRGWLLNFLRAHL